MAKLGELYRVRATKLILISFRIDVVSSMIFILTVVTLLVASVLRSKDFCMVIV